MKAFRLSILALLFAAIGLSAPAFAQGMPSASVCNTCTASLSVTFSSSRVALPSTSPPFNSVLVFNAGTKDAFVALGDVTVNATTSNIRVPAGTAITFQANGTYLAAITGGSDTTTLRVFQSNGLLGFAGGGSSGSGAGDASAANQLLQLTQETASAASLAALQAALGNAIPTGANTIGNVGSASGDPCSSLAHTWTPISIVTAVNTKIVTGTSAKRTYLCHLFLFASAADNVGIVEGTGTNCGSSTAGVIGGATAAAGIVIDAASKGFVIGNGAFAVARTATTADDFCLITSTTAQLSGVAVWVQL